MKAYELQEATTDYDGVVQIDRERPAPSADEALVRIHAASLNYRDLAIANDDLVYPGAALPVVPLSDGAGELLQSAKTYSASRRVTALQLPLRPTGSTARLHLRRSHERPAAT